MISRELYINGKLCDLPVNYSPRLNRQLINPSELVSKDAQYSYSITLPPTSRNNAALGYVGVEEVYNKFNRRYSAELVINGIRIFKGYFKLSEVSANGYKGNLYKPNAKTSKEIFPSEKWSDMKGYYMDFTGFAESITKYNTDAQSGAQPAIFPYVLYGLLPKLPDNGYGERDEWDERVELTLKDIHPSISLLPLIRAVFESRGMSLTGDAFSDKNLKDIYVSYKNEPGYEQPWNYMDIGHAKIKGEWSSANMSSAMAPYEQGAVYSTVKDDAAIAYVSQGSNCRLEVLEDVGQITRNGIIRVPVSGYYKIRLDYALRLREVRDSSARIKWSADPATGMYHAEAACKDSQVFELRLMRNSFTWDELKELRLDSSFIRDNLNQEGNSSVRYYPQNGGALMVDELQDPYLVFGVSNFTGGGIDYYSAVHLGGYNRHNVLVKSPFQSWSDQALVSSDKRNLTLFPCPGYWRYEGGRSVVSDKFKIELSNAPAHTWNNTKETAEGTADVIAWLNEGEELTLISVSQLTDSSDGSGSPSSKRESMSVHSYSFVLELTPYRIDRSWIPLEYLEKDSLPRLDWGENATFESGRLDLFGFMPATEKVSDFVDNVCKAFNLRLTDLGDGGFSLDKGMMKAENNYVNLDGIGAVAKRVNQPLNMPSSFNLSFTVNDKEEGKYTGGDRGVSGSISTGTLESGTVEQKCNFSYNWFKKIIKGSVSLNLPIISEHEVWTEDSTYKEAMEKVYTNLAQRFWFYDGTFEAVINGNNVHLARVTNTKGMELSYENKDNTILSLYFTTLVDANSHYTEIECYLTPDLYEALNGRKKAIFNSDVYYVAEISGYDPSGRNKTKIKLIKRI